MSVFRLPSANISFNIFQVIDSDNHGTDVLWIICKESHADLKRFIGKTWGKAKILKSDLYRDATVEVTMQQKIGNARYHSKCYGYYTAVKKYRYRQISKTTLSQTTKHSKQKNKSKL